jgi:hypothetical protein
MGLARFPAKKEESTLEKQRIFGSRENLKGLEGFHKCENLQILQGSH